MLSLLFLSILLLGVSDPLIRSKEDSKIKRIWLKIFKKPLIETITTTIKKLTDKLNKRYGGKEYNEFMDVQRLIKDFSRFAYIFVFISVVLIIVSLIMFIMNIYR